MDSIKKMKAFKKKLLFEELSENAREEEEAMQHYRRVRDQINIFVEQLPDTLINKKPDIEFDPRQLLNGISADLNPISED